MSRCPHRRYSVLFCRQAQPVSSKKLLCRRSGLVQRAAGLRDRAATHSEGMRLHAGAFLGAQPGDRRLRARPRSRLQRVDARLNPASLLRGHRAGAGSALAGPHQEAKCATASARTPALPASAGASNGAFGLLITATKLPHVAFRIDIGVQTSSGSRGRNI
jgi:hypothetical protein